MGATIRRQTIAPAPRASNVVAQNVGQNATHGATWTAERVDQLKVCIRSGLSCSRIAAEIGVSRNAVIGKMNRLGLSRARKAPAREPEPKGTASGAGNGGSNVTRIFSQHRILMRLPAEPQGRSEVISIDGGRGCSLLELGPGNCRWPISEPGARDYCFCGSTQVEGLPYCVGHARIAYKSGGRG